MTLLRSHATSLGLILGIGFLLLVSLVLTGALAVFGKNWGSIYPGVATALYVLNFLLSLAVVTALIAMLYKWLPNVAIAWRDVWIGALTTAVLFIAGQTAIGFYLTRSAMGSAYGAAGAMVVLLTWLYYSAQIFLFGAEFTQAYANRCAAIGMDCLSKDGAFAAHREVPLPATLVARNARGERCNAVSTWPSPQRVPARLLSPELHQPGYHRRPDHPPQS